MRVVHLLVLSGAVAAAACNPFHRKPVTEVTRDANVNSRWQASLVTPASLAGAVQMNGMASMEPNANYAQTDFSLSISNATPGGIHPWQVRRGQCGTDYGVLGSAESYRSIKIDDGGRGESNATITMTMPTEGNYFVTVQASAKNPETIVACGNLAPPTR